MRSLVSISTKLFLVGAGLVAGTLAFQGAPQPDGAAIFKERCSMCHGADGKGFAALKTPDFTDPKWQKSVKDKDLIEVIKNGKKDTPMLAFGDKLKGNEIQATVAYIRSLGSKKK